MMSAVELTFLAFAALAVFSAIVTMTRSNPVVAAVWLVASFFSVAVCYVLLSATFLAAIQVLVYAGAMMVLFVFVIMVLDVDESGRAEHRRPSPTARAGYFAAVGITVGFLIWVLTGTLARQYVTYGPPLELRDFGSADSLGRLLFYDYLFAFESVSFLLLAAVVGAVVVARSRRDREKEAVLRGFAGTERSAAGLDPDDLADEVLGHSPVPAHDFGAPSATGHDGGT